MNDPAGGPPGAGAGTVRPLRATVDLSRIRRNVAYLKSLTGPECAFMAVVKANAYGHGDLEVSRAALEAGADCLGVALVEEGWRLRIAGFDCPTYLLFEPPPSAARKVVELDLTSVVCTEAFARALSDAANAAGRKVEVHIKVDSGMRRYGIDPGDAGGFAGMLGGLPGLDVTGISTHFAVATRPDDPFTGRQMKEFDAAAAAAERVLGRGLVRHAANSAGVMAFPGSHYDMVRVGIAMLGLAPSEQVPGTRRLEPALSWTGEVAFVKRVGAREGVSYGLRYATARRTGIATLPVGYADGLSRTLSGKAEVLIRGKRWPIAGTICMDACMVDVGDEDVRPGTPFVLIGTDGKEAISAEEVASKMGTINYEITCLISPRVPRVFTGNKGDCGDEALP